MKKSLKILFYVITVFIVILIGFGIYYAVHSTNKNDEQIQSKVISEIEYIDEKLISFFNDMNNVEYENYKLVVQELGTTNNSKEDQKLSESTNLTNGESQTKESSNNQSQNTSQGSLATNSESKEETKKYSMEEAGILVDSKDINWEKLQTQVENLYISIPTITLDIYKVTKNQEEILKFNSQFDELTQAMKTENKEETLSKLVNLYETINNFVTQVSKSDNEKIISQTKLNILKAYSKLDSKNWQEIANDIQIATKNFEILLTDIEVSEQKQYTINKVYIMLNEMLSAVEKQDQDVFLIKYKNLLEELNSI